MKLLEFVFSGFFTFIGCMIILGGVMNFLFLIWNRFWRHWNIRKHGYPPPHCDADGDIYTDEEDGDNETSQRV